MHQRKYFTLNFFINEIFSVEKFPNYGISNHLINFLMCTECKKGQKPIKRLKLRIRTVLHCLFKIIKLLIITSRPPLLNFLLGTGNKILINVGLNVGILPVILALCSMLLPFYHDHNYAGITGSKAHATVKEFKHRRRGLI